MLGRDHKRTSPVLDRDHKRTSPVLGRDHKRTSPVLGKDHKRTSPVLDRDHKRTSYNMERYSTVYKMTSRILDRNIRTRHIMDSHIRGPVLVWTV